MLMSSLFMMSIPNSYLNYSAYKTVGIYETVCDNSNSSWFFPNLRIVSLTAEASRIVALALKNRLRVVVADIFNLYI